MTAIVTGGTSPIATVPTAANPRPRRVWPPSSTAGAESVTVTAAAGDTDVLSGIEDIVGSATLANTFTANARSDTFTGGAGDDTFRFTGLAKPATAVDSVTAGAGVGLGPFVLDYAFERFTEIGQVTHRVGIRFGRDASR